MSRLGLQRNVGNLLTFLQLLRVLEAQIQFLLEGVGVLVASHRDVAGEEWNASANDVDIHDAGADVQQGRHLIGRGLIIGFVSVLQRKGVDVHHGRVHLRRGDGVPVAENFVLLHNHQHHVVAAGRPGTKHVVVMVNVRNIKSDVLGRLVLDGVVQLRLARRAYGNPFHDYGVARN